MGLLKVEVDGRKTDISLEDVVPDIVRLAVGAPTLWRTVRPVTPIFSILLALALPIGPLMAFCAWHESEIFRLGFRTVRSCLPFCKIWYNTLKWATH